MNLEAGAVDAIVVDIGDADYQLESRTGFAMLDDKIRTVSMQLVSNLEMKS